MSTVDGAAEPERPAAEVEAGCAPPDEQARREADDAEDRWLRAVAELDTLRRRCAQQVADGRSAGQADAAARWLPVLDNLERALDAAESTQAGADPLTAGVQAVRDQAVSVLADLGFRRHAETRVPFDPRRHEAVGVSHVDDCEPGLVVEVVRAGYGDGDRQLRPVGVLVAARRD